MADIAKMFEGVNVAIVAADADFKVVYENEKCRKLFQEVFGREDYVGSNLSECHKPETTEKMKAHYQDFKERKKGLYFFTMDLPNRKGILVNVPYYEGGRFAGVVELVFEIPG
ncbi:MAG: PAS domain-containing protein [bacterium]